MLNIVRSVDWLLRLTEVEIHGIHACVRNWAFQSVGRLVDQSVGRGRTVSRSLRWSRSLDVARCQTDSPNCFNNIIVSGNVTIETEC